MSWFWLLALDDENFLLETQTFHLTVSSIAVVCQLQRLRRVRAVVKIAGYCIGLTDSYRPAEPVGDATPLLYCLINHRCVRPFLLRQ